MKTLAAAALFLSFLVTAQVSRAQDAPKPPSATGAASPNKIDPAKEADIRHLLELMGSVSTAQQVMDRMTQSIRPLMASSLPPGDYRDKLIDLFFAKFESKFDAKQIINLAVVRYDQHFSDEEIRGLITFYETPLGKKASKELPALTAELQTDGQQMGQDIGRQSMMEVLQEHPELEKAMEDAAQSAAPQH